MCQEGHIQVLVLWPLTPKVQRQVPQGCELVTGSQCTSNDWPQGRSADNSLVSTKAA